MELELGTAIIAGIVGTGVMTLVMAMGSMMGMGMDIPKMLGAMFFPAGAAARLSGLILHFMMGAIFFIIYAALFDALGIEDANRRLERAVRRRPRPHGRRCYGDGRRHTPENAERPWLDDLPWLHGTPDRRDGADCYSGCSCHFRGSRGIHLSGVD